MRVITVSNRETPGLNRYLASCRKFGIEPEILGVGEPFPAMCTRLVYVIRRLRELPEDEIVLFSDSWDVVFVRSLDDLQEVFLSFSAPCVFSAEPHFLYIKADKYKQWQRYPAGTEVGLYRFINGGGWIARAGYMADMLEEIDCPPDYSCDQTLFNQWFIEHPDRIVLDHEQKVFSSTIFREGFEHTDFETVDGVLRNKQTGSTPCLVHFGGENALCSAKILDMLPFPLPRLPTTAATVWDYYTKVVWLRVLYGLGLKPYPHAKPLEWVLKGTGVLLLCGLAALALLAV